MQRFGIRLGGQRQGDSEQLVGGNPAHHRRCTAVQVDGVLTLDPANRIQDTTILIRGPCQRIDNIIDLKQLRACTSIPV